MKQNLIVLFACAIVVAMSPRVLRAQSSTGKDSAITTKLRMESVRELEKNEDFQTALDVIAESGDRAQFEDGTLTTRVKSGDFSVTIPITSLGGKPQDAGELHYQEMGGKPLVYFTEFKPSDADRAPAPGGIPPPFLHCRNWSCGNWKVIAVTDCITIMQDLCHTDAFPPESNVHMNIMQRKCVCNDGSNYTFVQTIMSFLDCNCIEPL